MTATHSGQPPVDSFKAYVASIKPPPGTDLTYRPKPMLLTARRRRTVSAELRKLMREREKFRVAFVDLQAAFEKAEEDDAISVETFADMDERRNEALNALNIVNDEVLLFEPQSLADLRVVVAMARHLIATSEVREDFLEHLLASVERLVLEVGYE